jgi:hypothetical protein
MKQRRVNKEKKLNKMLPAKYLPTLKIPAEYLSVCKIN